MVWIDQLIRQMQRTTILEQQLVILIISSSHLNIPEFFFLFSCYNLAMNFCLYINLCAARHHGHWIKVTEIKFEIGWSIIVIIFIFPPDLHHVTDQTCNARVADQSDQEKSDSCHWPQFGLSIRLEISSSGPEEGTICRVLQVSTIVVR